MSIARIPALLLGVLLITAVIGCSNDQTVERGRPYVSDDPSAAEYLRFLVVGQVPDSKMAELSATLIEYRPRVMEHLGVTEMPRVSIVVWQDPDAFEEEYGENAENVAGFLDPEDWGAHMLNVNRTLGLGTVHEFTHLVSLARNPEIPNNPKWLWEAVAIYESNRPPPPQAIHFVMHHAHDDPAPRRTR